MSESSHDGLLDKVKEKFAEARSWLRGSPQISNRSLFNSEVANCFRRLEFSISKKYQGFDDISNEVDNARNGSVGDVTWMVMRNRITGHYETLLRQFENYIDEENAIHRNERRAQWRALWFRIATTFGVGLTIMGIYALAHWWKIPMPLMRMPG